MLDPVDHIEYYYVKGQGWVPQVIRQEQPRRAAMPANFGSPGGYYAQPYVTITTSSTTTFNGLTANGYNSAYGYFRR